MAVTVEPTTFTWGRDGTLGKARPALSTATIKSEYVTPAPKVT